MAPQTAERVCGSYGSFGSPFKKSKERTSCSQPFTKPNMKLTERLKRKVLMILGYQEKEDFTFDESKLIIRGLSDELNKILQIRDSSLLTRVCEDGSSVEERQCCILHWADEVKHSLSPEQMKEEHNQTTSDHMPDEELRLKEARKVLSDWAWSLNTREKDKLCLGDDVCSVLQDLERQWKKGNLPSMLPVMDFLIWSLLQEHTNEGCISKQWLTTKQRFGSRVALNHIPDSVWDWISKASDDITLDPDTANPSLKVSRDRKRVKMDTIIESQHNPWDGYSRTLSQYDGWWCVQGAQGFTSGRHYWEVEVRGKNEWRIGVVRESAPRHGFVDLNTTAGYWTLRLQLGQLMAMTSPVTKLERSAPSRLGVFLDMEEGQVSFYDAQQKRHIYTFDADFGDAGKIYPVFGTFETDREIKIL
ncbi:butyrophilin subfamily 3 member A1-like [Hypomesus transpacificus]|uniref:butyrophilin subfamily 3 member A1-like n=1 Tax=Hypomesus transpacificus TaxID=137520 RepID=UPI001F0718E4|nr:butyrophilin subfamily 3 member A1-like [Hypomesus transpacificus]